MSKGSSRNPHSYPLSSLATAQWGQQAIAIFPSWAASLYLVPKAKSASGNTLEIFAATGLKNNSFKVPVCLATSIYNPLSDLCLFMSWNEHFIVLKKKPKSDFREGHFSRMFTTLMYLKVVSWLLLIPKQKQKQKTHEGECIIRGYYSERINMILWKLNVFEFYQNWNIK